jgi:hypothetical protein
MIDARLALDDLIAQTQGRLLQRTAMGVKTCLASSLLDVLRVSVT